jgi:ribosomal protein RSM22 (predicted rRNA methylase)
MTLLRAEAVRLNDILRGRIVSPHKWKSETAATRDGVPQRIVYGERESLAYVATRAHATYAVNKRVLSELYHRLGPSYAPISMMDVGSGPGTATWAATELFPSLTTLSLIEPSESMRDIAKRILTKPEQPTILADSFLHPSTPTSTEEEEADATGAASSPGESVDGSSTTSSRQVQVSWRPWLSDTLHPKSFDLITVSYLLNELNAKDIPALMSTLADYLSPTGMLCVIEPGTPSSFAEMNNLRTWALQSNLNVLAPCTHQNTCPAAAEGVGLYCHFRQRVTPFLLGDAEKGFSDEKFTYFIFSKQRLRKGPTALGRIITPPLKRKGHVIVDYCGGKGELLRNIVGKRGELWEGQYASARKSSWGDLWETTPPPNVPVKKEKINAVLGGHVRNKTAQDGSPK